MLFIKNVSYGLMLLLCLLGMTFSGCATIEPSYDTSAYANTVVSYRDIPHPDDAANILGITSYPEMVNFKDVRLGRGWIVVDMGEGEEIIDRAGSDFRVYESDAHFRNTWRNDTYQVFVSEDGTRWHDLGYAHGTDEFDIADVNLDLARYVKIAGVIQGHNRSSGPEIEAVEALHMPPAREGTLATGSKSADRNQIPVENTLPETPRSYLADIDFGTYQALIIGNNAYQYLPPLKTARNDAEEVAKILNSQYGFKIELLLDASRSQVLTVLNNLRWTLTPQDNLLIYYAGHGWLDKEADEGYWLPVDAQKNNVTNWISNSSITASLRALKAKHVLIVADSCYSGKLARGVHIVNKTPGYIARLSEKKARSVISSGGLEPVTDSGGDGQHSVFASALLKTLGENRQILESSQLFQRLRRPVMLNSDQTPEFTDIRKAGHEGGEFLFVPINKQP